jgi:hypothetical protein
MLSVKGETAGEAEEETGGQAKKERDYSAVFA